jgi:DNA-binding transcriptional regulator YhcF (GntR family)
VHPRRLIVTPDSTVPLYLQVKHQLAYLIIGGSLARGTRLPAVRELAQELAINPGTVVQAYRELADEGLIGAQRGLGTFVLGATAVDTASDAYVRMQLLDDALTRALQRGLDLGFDPAQIQQRLAQVGVDRLPLRRVVFIAPTRPLGRKYERLLREHFGGQRLHVTTATIDELEEASTLRAIVDTYLVVTLASLHHQLDAWLRGRALPNRVVSLTTVVSSATLAELAAVPAGASVGLIAEPRSLYSALNLLANESTIGADVPRSTLDSVDDVAALVQAVDVVVHTYSSAETLDLLGVDATRRIEIRFDVQPESMAALAAAIGIEIRKGDTPHRTSGPDRS